MILNGLCIYLITINIYIQREVIWVPESWSERVERLYIYIYIHCFQMSSTIFDDIFTIQEIDQGRYNKVSRIEATSTSQESCKLTLDVNTELFPLKPQQQLTVMLATTLNASGGEDTGASWRAPVPGTRSLADDFDYVMYGTAYKFEEAHGNKDMLAVYYSFGGLLMRLEGNYRLLSNFKQENVYLLCRH
ncbi:DNA-directed RNA polymerase core subunit RPB8 Ecym_8331 [Eremothecium cymbalariae DBVPG|uniref:DNA-directed RNA polymerases I, II, and III subunit RPABC3 n=1 Tax=Eremothecium cymbalariae (strain CBS 270.75 / DBVPG 7215 / KCTC 17166 / NRRL Y-17582) TaxID=931890 RepID=G8JXN5_ERECY|nr:Hypothetical protein Ecym_8331 [Eremothecium cymbalariae DBVPG\